MLIKALNIEVKLIDVNIRKGEHLTPEFRMINPQHTIPTLVEDDGFILVDSHAIMGYLVDKYGKDDSLYPRDLRKRATVNHRLHFECGILLPRNRALFRPTIFFWGKRFS